jgi:bacterial/archaeal transporter family-2 protein
VPASSAFWAILGVVAGGMIALQAPLNAQLARALGSPIAAAAVSFTAGAAVLVALTTVLVVTSGPSLTWQGIPPWLFVTGGFLGAFFVTCSIILTPKLGAAAFLGFAVAGQLVAGLLLDHFGLFGLAIRELSLGRLAGAACLIAGAVLLRTT